MAAGNVVTGIDPSSAAYAAGLRDGMRLLHLELGGDGDSRVPLTYRVADGAKTREITYLPAGKQLVSVQEFRLADALDDAKRKACGARLAGTD